MYFRLLLFLVIAAPSLAFSQGPMPLKGGMSAPMFRVFGKVLDAESGKSMGYAIVNIYSTLKDTLVAGGLSDSKGDFSFDKIPAGKIKVLVTFPGYDTLKNEFVVGRSGPEQDLGNLRLTLSAKKTDEVTISRQRSTFTMNIDKKTYNVGSDISAQGGTATDVLKNVPGVNVDGEGNVTLRNSSTQIYVDGKPSMLTLQQIPADQIEKIEVITNPSVKFEASTTGGIINVVLKKNNKPGYNGSVVAGGGTMGRYNGMASLNIKQNRINLSLSYSINGKSNIYRANSERINYSGQNISNSFLQENENFASNYFQFAKIGLDYKLNNRSTISFSENFSSNSFRFNDKVDFTLRDSAQNISQKGERSNISIAAGYNITSEVSFRHNFPKKDREFTAFVNHNYNQQDRDYTFTTYTYDGNGNLLPSQPSVQFNDGGGYSNQVVMQADYTNPRGEFTKTEFGVRNFTKENVQLNNTMNFDYASNSFVKDTGLSNNYRILEMVNAAYFNYITKYKKVGIQAGLRFEQSYYSGKIAEKNVSFMYNFPGSASTVWRSLFPGIYLNHKFNDSAEIQFNVSRKISRPNFWQLSPFVMTADQQNIRIGNPTLQPEFTNLSEINLNKIFKRSRLLSSVYAKLTENPITSATFASPNDPQVLISTFVNGKTSFSFGTEHTYRRTFSKKLDVMLNANAFYYRINSPDPLYGASNGGLTLNSKLSATYSFDNTLRFQLNGNYESPRYILNGRMMQVWSVDFSVNKIINKKFILTLSANDIFNTRLMGTVLETDNYYQSSYRRWDVRYFKINLAYNFGKQDASIFRSKPKRQEENNGGGGMEF